MAKLKSKDFVYPFSIKGGKMAKAKTPTQIAKNIKSLQDKLKKLKVTEKKVKEKERVVKKKITKKKVAKKKAVRRVAKKKAKKKKRR